MALSPTEEALIRQLLGQQAAILSLAGSEPTIMSKLSATKVTIPELPTAGTLAAGDLVVARQDVTDVKLTLATLKTFVTAGGSTIAFEDGTAALPSITNLGDEDTGFYFPAANAIGASTAGIARLRITPAGRLGVGTATPTALIEAAVTPSAGATDGISVLDLTTNRGAALYRAEVGHNYAGASGVGAILYSSDSLTLVADITGGSNPILFSTGNVIRMRVLGNGRVGIGTATPDALLTVNGVASFGDGSAGAPSIANLDDLNTGLFFPAADTVAVAVGGAEALRVSASGNVGIGDTTPTRKLDITVSPIAGADDGISIVDAVSTNSAALNRTEAGYNYAGVTGAVATVYSSNTLALIADSVGGSNPILFSAGNAERMRIQSTGAVGIGTATPDSRLSVNGQLSVTAGSASAPAFACFGDLNTGVHFPAVDTMALATGGVNRILMTASGTVGIGLSVPALPLQVAGDIGAYSTTGNVGLRFQTTSGSGREFSWISATTGNAVLYDHTASADRLVVNSSGQFGVGTAPAEQLHITGNFRIGSAVQATPSGAAPLYAARAWVNFNGTGAIAIRSSGNVSSITDNGTGDYTVNFAVAMPDANYAITAAAKEADTTSQSVSVVNPCPAGMTAASARIVTANATQTPTDMAIVCLALHR